MNAYLPPGYSVPESLRASWPHSVLWRLQCGDPVSRRELNEVEQYFSWWQEEKAAVEREEEETERQEAALLEELTPPIALAEEVLRLAGVSAELAYDTRTRMARLLRPYYLTSSDRARYMPPDVETKALEKLVNGLDIATEAGSRLIGRANNLLVGTYRTLAYRLVRRFERRPSCRGTFAVSPQAATFCWNSWLHIGLLRDAARIRLNALKRTGGRPKSSDWKKPFALEAAALVYKARLDSGLNAPLPHGNDRSSQAVALIIEQGLRHLGQNLSRTTIDEYAKKAVTLLRKLHQANWDDTDASLNELERETVMNAELPRCCYQEPVSRQELDENEVRSAGVENSRWGRWRELMWAFEQRTGLSGAADRLR